MFVRFGSPVFVGALSVLVPLISGGYTPPGPEVEDGYYRDSAGLTQRWFGEPEVELHTPGSRDARWTTVEEAYAFMEALAARGDNLVVREVGESLLGIPIKALFHEVDDAEALTVLVQARVHGNEPASTEGALELAYGLAAGELAELDINVILLPVLNPEGARAMRRRTGTDIDPNRDYMLHNSGSVRAVFRLIRDYDPEVILDMHEHDAFGWPFDLMTIGPNNPNIPQEVRDYTAGVFIDGMRKAYGKAGLRLGPYRLLDYPDEGIRVRESATTFVSAKNALAMAGRISLLTEGRGIGLGTQHFRRRTLAQYTAARAVLETAAAGEAEIRGLVRAARAQIAGGLREWILRVDPVEVPARHALLDAGSLEVRPVETVYWERTKGVIARRLEVPPGYVIEASATALADRLRRFGLELERVSEPVALEVEILTVESAIEGSGILYGGDRMREDGAPVRPAVLRDHEIAIRTERKSRQIPAGSWIVRTDQPNSLYLMALEPECPSGFASLSFWGGELVPGFEFPVYRLVGNAR